jgi:phosphatidylinositol glycan class O
MPDAIIIVKKYLLSHKIVFFVFWFLLLHGTAVLIFTNGFLLTRYEMKNHSYCQKIPSESYTQYKSLEKNKVEGHALDESCWTQPNFTKAIILLIDALRFDFVLPDVRDTTNVFYRNQLPIVRHLLQTRSAHSLLYKFIADPPTTTMQRLKALTTGGMPTFIDASDNFDPSQSIKEDNWVWQLVQNGKRIVFMGDDTWTHLYPRHFLRSYPFPSFNVKDLHTVDNGILEHLIPEIQKNDWDVLIAHFLGVDHVGHRHGPSHPTMMEKLQQMNKMLQDVISAVDKLKQRGDEVLLIVMGDHGMTNDGNHGGATSSEVEAALFIYSTYPLLLFNVSDTFQQYYGASYNSVSQIDVVPTICLLLGIPIPFGNLGILIPELFLHVNHTLLSNETAAVSFFSSLSSIQKDNFLAALEKMNAGLNLNIWQIFNYLSIYSHKTQQFPIDTLTQLQQYLKRSESIFRRIFNDNGTKVDGDSLFRWHLSLFHIYRSFHSLAIELCRRLWTTFDVKTMAFGILILSLSVICLAGYLLIGVTSFDPQKTFSIHISTVVMAAILHKTIFHFTQHSSSVSQSYIYYFGIGAVCALFINIRQSLTVISTFVYNYIKYLTGQKTLTTDFSTTKRKSHVHMHVVFTILCLIFRISGLFSNSYIEAEYSVLYFLIISQLVVFILHYDYEALHVLKLVVLLAVLRVTRELTRGGNFESYEVQNNFFLFVLRFTLEDILPLCLLNIIRQKESKSSNVTTYLSNFIFWSIILMIEIYWLWLKLGLLDNSFTIRILFPNVIYFYSVVGTILSFWRKATTQKHLWEFALPSFVLVSGPKSCPNVFFLFVSIRILGDILSKIEWTHWTAFSLSVLWSMFATFYFYATGHTPDFNSIPFSAAFIGYDTYNYWIGLILIALNIWGPHIFWTFSLSVLISKPVTENQEKNAYFESNTTCSRDIKRRYEPMVFQVFGAYMLVNSLCTLATMSFNHVARRHLMVWRVFAPKYVFDSLTLLVIDVTLLIIALIRL